MCREVVRRTACYFEYSGIVKLSELLKLGQKSDCPVPIEYRVSHLLPLSLENFTRSIHSLTLICMHGSI